MTMTDLATATAREGDYRAAIADTLLHLLMAGVISRDDMPHAVAATGLTWPDLEAANVRRRKHGWRGPTPAPVPLAGLTSMPTPTPRIPVETPAERIDRTRKASHTSQRYREANPEPGKKRCARCKEVKPIESFALRSATSGSTQRRSYCPPCWKEKQRERYLSVQKSKMLNEVGLTFVVVEGDDVDGLACVVCLHPIKPGDTVHGRATLIHTDCQENR